jgi:predicted kinase
MVRCMATLISAEQADAEYRQRHVDDANAYLRLASEIAAKESLRFCAITVGVAGTGKSTVADLIATQWNAVHLKTDTIRRELAEVGPTDRTGFAVREGMYTAGMSRRTYDEMRRRAQQELSAGNSMVMDGTHLQRRHRKTSLDQGRYAGVFTIIVECTLEEAEAHSRLGSRYSSGTSESEGRPEVYTEQVQT